MEFLGTPSRKGCSHLLRVGLLVLAGLPHFPLLQAASLDAPEDDTAQRARLAANFLKERLALWKQRLDLDAWDISLRLCRRDGMMKPRTLGGIRWDKRKKTAEIQVLDPSEYRVPASDMLADMEFTIVHELIHLELASLPRSEASRSDEEHAVNQMTRALLNLDRRAPQ